MTEATPLRAALGGAFERARKLAGTAQLEHVRRAFAVSADGNVIVGMGAGQAMIWTAHEPPRFLRDVLADDGVDVSDWRFDMALDISADGKLIAGNGYCQGREVGFVARLR